MRWGLSQADFRNFLLSSNNSKPAVSLNNGDIPEISKPKKPKQLKRTLNDVDDDDLDDLQSKSSGQQKQKKLWSSTPKESNPYRDRAKERRIGLNPDYEDTDKIFAVLNSSTSNNPANILSQDETPSNAISYEQSKYLGGDIKHTHLVKGLDFELLKRVKQSSGNEQAKSNEEKEAKAYVDEMFGGIGPPTIKSKFAKSIYEAAMNQAKFPEFNDMFIPGRMSYVWDLGFDDNDEYQGSSDIPTTIIKSRADVQEAEIRALAKSNNEFVIQKIARIMSNRSSAILSEKKNRKKEKGKLRNEPSKIELIEPSQVLQDNDDDIFMDAGSKYTLTVVEKQTQPLQNTAKNYFLESSETNIASTANVLQVENQSLGDFDNDMEPVSKSQNDSEKSDLETKESSQTITISKLLSSAGLDSSFITSGVKQAKKKPDTALQSGKLQSLSKTSSDPMKDFDPYTASIMDFSDDEYDMSDEDVEAEQMDMGTRINKKKQLQRFDFEDEEKWQEYKESQVKIPKAAFSFGVKTADGGGGSGTVVKRAMKKGDHERKVWNKTKKEPLMESNQESQNGKSSGPLPEDFANARLAIFGESSLENSSKAARRPSSSSNEDHSTTPPPKNFDGSDTSPFKKLNWVNAEPENFNSDSNFIGKKRRRRTTMDEQEALELYFERNPLPNSATRQELAEKTGMTARAVQVWFQNRRQALKKKQAQADERSKREKIQKQHTSRKPKPGSSPSSSNTEQSTMPHYTPNPWEAMAHAQAHSMSMMTHYPGYQQQMLFLPILAANGAVIGAIPAGADPRTFAAAVNPHNHNFTTGGEALSTQTNPTASGPTPFPKVTSSQEKKAVKPSKPEDESSDLAAIALVDLSQSSSSANVAKCPKDEESMNDESVADDDDIAKQKDESQPESEPENSVGNSVESITTVQVENSEPTKKTESNVSQKPENESLVSHLPSAINVDDTETNNSLAGTISEPENDFISKDWNS
ncbi:hypothetical protein HK096_001041 [Nowakowskiella sp. JEL0078]|nr:hypothetical protein HK096_001041 [Nowakowskiella sp. JEL0078]